MLSRLRALIISARPKQWIKNLFLFSPLLFSKHLFDLRTLQYTIAGFILFSVGASCIYLLNDIADRKKDRLHPVKCLRPIASGTLPLSWVIGTLIIFFPLVISVSFILNHFFGIALVAYLSLNIVYSFYLKEVVILDVMSIAASFVLRIVSGAFIIDVPISEWLLICTSLLALFLGFSKRRHEIVILESSAHNHRPVLMEYNINFLDQMMSLVTAATLICYILYTVDEQTVQKFHSKNLLYSAPFVLYGLFRYLYLVHQKKSGGDPTSEVVSDKPLLINIALWAMVVIIIIYTR